MTTYLLLSLAFVALMGCSAFFSSAETAFFALDPLQLKKLADEHPTAERRVRWLMNSPTSVLSTILIGNTIVNIVLSNIGYAIAESVTPTYGETIAVAGTTVLLVFFGELGPKRLALRHAPFLARGSAQRIRNQRRWCSAICPPRTATASSMYTMISETS